MEFDVLYIDTPFVSLGIDNCLDLGTDFFAFAKEFVHFNVSNYVTQGSLGKLTSRICIVGCF